MNPETEGRATPELTLILEAMAGLKRGDFGARLPREWTGVPGKIADAFNEVVESKGAMAAEFERLCRAVAKEGKLQQRAEARGAAGAWLGMFTSVNSLVEELVRPIRELSRVAGAVAKGDLSQSAELDSGGRPLEGELLKTAQTVNTMVSLLGSFTAEVTRVAREVGTEGNLGGRAIAPGASGTWKELADNVNRLASNLAGQVRDIAEVTTAVANGDLSKKIAADARGEFLQLKDRINTMVDQLRFFTSEVTRVAREVGVEGRLGGQAIAPGSAGSWKDLTDNVNQLAANLTTQVRAIAEIAVSVTKGDLTRSISVEAQGEVQILKDALNRMIANLRVTTQQDADQVWLKTNLARFALMSQGQTDLHSVSAAILTELSKVVSAQHGVFYIAEAREGLEPRLRMLSAFAKEGREDMAREFALGEGLVGQCARDKETILVTDPPADYIKISSGLGGQRPANIIVLPVLFGNQLKAVLELASFDRFSPIHRAFLAQLTESIGIILNTAEASVRTGILLKNLQAGQEELRNTNQSLEEKAVQLALTSKYKSVFLSNMSHELRTPLNSMLILSQQLAEDPENLSKKQVEYAETIHASGGDLLALINDILDLSKVESGTLELDMEDLSLAVVHQHLERTFGHLARNKDLEFSIDYDPSKLDRIHTDGKRLEQILRNLLSNAFKFTESGQVVLTVRSVTKGWSPDHAALNAAKSVVAFTVTDSGIGIPPEKQRIIFEAFQQADGGTSRKYGGTGLGLSICRELAKLLGCELVLERSAPGQGSAFVLYMPNTSSAAAGAPAEKAAVEAKAPPLRAQAVRRPPGNGADDSKNIEADDVVLLIVEDDPVFAGILVDGARKKGFKTVVARNGRSAVKLAGEIKVDAVTLDIRLPDMDGWGVLSRFKGDPATRHVPIQVIAVDDDRGWGTKHGAMAFLAKPVSRQELSEALDGLRALRTRAVKNLLLVCAQASRAKVMTELLAGDDVKLTLVKTGREALEALREGRLDCVVMEVPDPESLVVLNALETEAVQVRVPIVVHIREDLSPRDEALIKKLSASGPLREVKSMERLLDDTALVMHRMLAAMPVEKKTVIENLYQWSPVLAERKILVVDDDIRNIFAMTSLLENSRMSVLTAESGADALAILGKRPDVELVLMDIMMPDMDGYEAIRVIRKDPRFLTLPIIAVTAKAMKGDRERCIEAGASDYITKPVDTQHLLSMMRFWLHR
ncbi:MAG TPA: response regulator [bacterium]|jgi:signal transduction histidine kinase/DNA-binding response OmpR family regulator/HAMP domain-containing protein|nr:response regulator [bacterium]